MQTIFAILTARKGSVGVPSKNIMVVNGHPLFSWNVQYANMVPAICRTFVYSDDERILVLAGAYNFVPLVETEHGTHAEAMVRAGYAAEKVAGATADLFIVLLGNAAHAYPWLLQEAIDILNADPYADSVTSVALVNAHSPFRAYVDKGDGYLQSTVPQEVIRNAATMGYIGDRRSAGGTYYYNGGFWVVRREPFLANDGVLPFTWLGHKIKYIVQPGELQELDEPWQTRLL